MEEQQRYRLLQRARMKNFIKRGILLMVAGLMLYGLVALVYATKTFYKVRRNYAVILEDLGGQRRVIDQVGWHSRLPFFTRLELEVSLMNQEMHLGGPPEPVRIVSQGNVALWTSAMLTYRIKDLERWGIENQTPLSLLQNDFDGIVKDVMQGHMVDDLISSRERIREEIFGDLKKRPINAGGPTLEAKYGIEVVSFILRDTRFGEKLAAASEEKKRRELIAEAENYAADQEASRTRKLYSAYSDSIRQFRSALGMAADDNRALFQFLNQQKWATAYEKNQSGQNTFVLNNSNGSTPVVLPTDRVQVERVIEQHEQRPKNPQPDLRQALRETH